MQYQKTIIWKIGLYFAFFASFSLMIPHHAFANMMQSRVQFQHKELAYADFHDEYVYKILPIFQDIGLSVDEISIVEAVIASENFSELLSTIAENQTMNDHMLQCNTLISSKFNYHDLLNQEMKNATLNEARRLVTVDNLIRIGVSKNEAETIVAELSTDDLLQILASDSIADYAAGYKLTSGGAGSMIWLILLGLALLVVVAVGAGSSIQLGAVAVVVGALIIIGVIAGWGEGKRMSS